MNQINLQTAKPKYTLHRCQEGEGNPNDYLDGVFFLKKKGEVIFKGYQWECAELRIELRDQDNGK
jgi:hypothetical protein